MFADSVAYLIRADDLPSHPIPRCRQVPHTSCTRPFWASLGLHTVGTQRRCVLSYSCLRSRHPCRSEDESSNNVKIGPWFPDLCLVAGRRRGQPGGRLAEERPTDLPAERYPTPNISATPVRNAAAPAWRSHTAPVVTAPDPRRRCE